MSPGLRYFLGVGLVAGAAVLGSYAAGWIVSLVR